MEQGRTSFRSGGQKLIPRDISESLGKLPPQSCDMEIAVLGAIMLEKKSIDMVPNLRPQHFYDDRHREVFNAILQLKSLNEPHDFRMVITQLRKTGKLELVGGHMYVVELTAAVSSAANIQSHAREIIENGIKRALIEAASDIHQRAYEADTDVLQLLDQQIEDLKFLRDRETASDGPERIRALWEKFQIVVKPDEQPPLVCIDQTPVVSPGDHTLLVGKKKSRKSLLVVHLLAQFLKSRENHAEQILVFDTEQGKAHVWKTRDRLYRMTNQHIPIFYLRGQKPQDRMDFISQTIAHWATRPKIVVIDGIRDCMSNINDPDETTNVIAWLERLTLEYNIGIINILHLNKTDGNARGHIGSELLNKTVATIEVEYDKKSGNSVVKCESSREKEFETFCFTHGPTGLPEIVGVPIGQNHVAKDEQLKKLQVVFEDGPMKYKELKELLMAHFEVGDTKAKQLIARFTGNNWIMKAGPNNSPKTTYKLLAQPGYTGMDDQKTIPVIPVSQSELFVPDSTDDLPF